MADADIQAEEVLGETSDAVRGSGSLRLPAEKGVAVSPVKIHLPGPRPTVTPLPPGADFTQSSLPDIVVGGDVVSYGSYRVANETSEAFAVESARVRQVSDQGRASDVAAVRMRFDNDDPACDGKTSVCAVEAAAFVPDAAGDWTVVPVFPRPLPSGAHVLVDLRAQMAAVSGWEQGPKSGDRPLLRVMSLRVRRADGATFDLAMPEDPLRGVARHTLRQSALGVSALPLSPNRPSPFDKDGWNLLAQGKFSARGGAVDLKQFALQVEGAKNSIPYFGPQAKEFYPELKFQVGVDEYGDQAQSSGEVYTAYDDGREILTFGKTAAWHVPQDGTLPFKVWAKFAGSGVVSGHSFKVRWYRGTPPAGQQGITGCLSSGAWFIGHSLIADGLTQDPKVYPFWSHAPELEAAFLWSDRSAKAHTTSGVVPGESCQTDTQDWTDGYGVSGFPSWSAGILQHLVVPLLRGLPPSSRLRRDTAGFLFMLQLTGAPMRDKAPREVHMSELNLLDLHRLVIARHGLCEEPRGALQVERLAKALASAGAARWSHPRIFASPQPQAAQPAEILACELGMAMPILVPALRMGSGSAALDTLASWEGVRAEGTLVLVTHMDVAMALAMDVGSRTAIRVPAISLEYAQAYAFDLREKTLRRLS
jgi:hypothetical protein